VGEKESRAAEEKSGGDRGEREAAVGGGGGDRNKDGVVERNSERWCSFEFNCVY
jgi:hypothetical protein